MTAEEAILAIIGMKEEDRQKVLQSFCRSCGTFIGTERDWSGQNHCDMCAPDDKDY